MIQGKLHDVYNLVDKLVHVLEEELNLLALHKSDNNIIASKNIADTLNKLVSLTSRLNKLSHEQLMITAKEVDQKDKMIIHSFLSKY